MIRQLSLVAIFAAHLLPVAGGNPALQAQALNPVIIDTSTDVDTIAPDQADIAGPSTYRAGTSAAPDGETLTVTQRYLVLNGKPWLPVMGEFHFSRYPPSQWEEEILKMKAGGVQIISTYVIWIHHEEVEGIFDWSGQRDLRGFLELCARHHMYVILRIGPWSHGEVRNGGFPDWLLGKELTRGTSPEFLTYAQRYYDQIAAQAKGLLWKDGGPVIGVQLDNEYNIHAPDSTQDYILTLRRMARSSGFDVPLYTITGWGNALEPVNAVIPMYGGYADVAWGFSLKDGGPGEVFNFRFTTRTSGNPNQKDADSGKVSRNPAIGEYPFMTAEAGGGGENTYLRRLIVLPDDAPSMFPVLVGSGVNLYGIYMYHGGRNPDGKQTTLEESQATKYPWATDVPVKSYDFQAPLSEFGEERESFRKLKVFSYFVNDFGSILAPMRTHPPTRIPAGPSDFSMPRFAARSLGTSGFLFCNNYVRHASMPTWKSVQVTLKLPGATLQVPRQPIDIPAGAYLIWPFNLQIGNTELRYSTAQLFTRLLVDGTPTYFFEAIPGITAEFAFDASTVSAVKSPTGQISNENGLIYLAQPEPGKDRLITVYEQNGNAVHIVLLTQEEAEDAWKVRLEDRDYLLLTQSPLYTLRDGFVLLNNGSPHFHFSLYPSLSISLHTSVDLQRSNSDAPWANFAADVPKSSVSLQIKKVHDAGKLPAVVPGAHQLPQAPAQSAFQHAATWSITLSPHPFQGVSDLFLHIDFKGDIAQLSSAGYLLDDNFFNGRAWTVGLKSFASVLEKGPLDLSILPMRKGGMLYLDDRNVQVLSQKEGLNELEHIQITPQYELPVRSIPATKGGYPDSERCSSLCFAGVTR